MSARSKLLRWLAILAVVVAVAHSGLWWFATGQLASGLEAWAAQSRAGGWTVNFSPPERRGWPLAATLGIAEMDIAETGVAGGRTWHASAIELTLSPAEPGLVRVRIAGAQRLGLPGLAPVGITAAKFALAIPLDDPEAADLAAEALRLALPGGGVEVGRLAAHGVVRPGAGRGQEALALAASAEAIVLPPAPDGRAWALGPRLAAVSLDASVSGPVAPPGMAPARRAAVWRDGGGEAKLRRLTIGWGPLEIAASASLKLDARLQPVGSGQIRLAGYEAALDALAAAGVTTPRAALAARAVMGLLARVPEGGGAAQVELPLTLNDNTLIAGRFPLLRVPDLLWPSP